LCSAIGGVPHHRSPNGGRISVPIGCIDVQIGCAGQSRVVLEQYRLSAFPL
jgi:hypothetical protein